MEATRPEHTSKGCTCVCSSTTLISAHITITCTHHCNTHNSIMSGRCRDQGGKTTFPARVYNNIPHYLAYQVPRTVMLSQVLNDNTLCKVASRSEDQPRVQLLRVSLCLSISWTAVPFAQQLCERSTPLPLSPHFRVIQKTKCVIHTSGLLIMHWPNPSSCRLYSKAAEMGEISSN